MSHKLHITVHGCTEAQYHEQTAQALSDLFGRAFSEGEVKQVVYNQLTWISTQGGGYSSRHYLCRFAKGEAFHPLEFDGITFSQLATKTQDALRPLCEPEISDPDLGRLVLTFLDRQLAATPNDPLPAKCFDDRDTDYDPTLLETTLAQVKGLKVCGQVIPGLLQCYQTLERHTDYRIDAVLDVILSTNPWAYITFQLKDRKGGAYRLHRLKLHELPDILNQKTAMPGDLRGFNLADIQQALGPVCAVIQAEPDLAQQFLTENKFRV